MTLSISLQYNAILALMSSKHKFSIRLSSANRASWRSLSGPALLPAVLHFKIFFLYFINWTGECYMTLAGSFKISEWSQTWGMSVSLCSNIVQIPLLTWITQTDRRSVTNQSFKLMISRLYSGDLFSFKSWCRCDSVRSMNILHLLSSTFQGINKSYPGNKIREW